MQAFGKIGRLFYDNKNLDMENELKKLKKISWERTSANWIGNTIRENGKVLNSEEAIGLTYKKIIDLMNIKDE